MSSPAENDPLHARLQEFLKRNLEPGSGFIPRSINPAPDETKPAAPPKPRFEFDLTPRQVKEHLDRFVIKQDEAKKVLAITVCDHYHHVQAMAQGKTLPELHQAKRARDGPDRRGQDVPGQVPRRADRRADGARRRDQIHRDRLRGRRCRGPRARSRHPGRGRQGRWRNTASFISTRSTSWPARRSGRGAT